MFIPFTPPPSSFATTLRGFIFLDKTDPQTEAEVSDIVANTLFTIEESTETTRLVKRFLVSHRDNLPLVISRLEDAMRYLRKSISVHRFDLVKKEDIGTGEGRKQPVWNIYIFPPTKDHGALRNWKRFIQGITFVTDSNGAGKTTKIFCCTVCRSEDHPGGMCPYPSQEGWISPPPAHSPALDSILNQPDPLQKNRTPAARGRGAPSHRSRGHNGRGGRNTHKF